MIPVPTLIGVIEALFLKAIEIMMDFWTQVLFVVFLLALCMVGVRLDL